MNAEREKLKIKLLAVLLLWSYVGVGGQELVQAASNTGSMTVNATIVAQCHFNPSGPSPSVISFGSYDPVVANATSPNNSTGSISYNCNLGTTGHIALNDGLYSGNANGTTRAMSDGVGDYLSYELYTDSSKSVVWSETNTVSYVGTGINSTVNVYGSVPPGQNVGAGNYTDTVIMTITY